MFQLFLVLVIGVAGYLIYLALKESFKVEVVTREIDDELVNQKIDKLKEKLKEFKEKQKDE